MKKCITILLFLLLESCFIPQYGTYKSDSLYYYFNNYSVEIISEPTGTIIEWDNQYLGKTPLTHVLNGKISTFHLFSVKATPVIAGQYTQTKLFYSPVPSKLYFNMNLVPTNNDYNINVDINKEKESNTVTSNSNTQDITNDSWIETVAKTKDGEAQLTIKYLLDSDNKVCITCTFNVKVNNVWKASMGGLDDNGYYVFYGGKRYYIVK